MGNRGRPLWLLQARPITRVPPRWTRDESAERFPSVVTPLAWDLVEEGFHLSLSHSLELMGMPPFHGKWFAFSTTTCMETRTRSRSMPMARPTH